MIHVTSLQEELSEQVTTPTILIRNINNGDTANNLSLMIWSDIYDAILCVRSIVHMNKNDG